MIAATWTSFCISVVVAVALLWVPGLVVLCRAKLTTSLRWASAPGVSVAVIGVAAMSSSVLHRLWWCAIPVVGAACFLVSWKLLRDEPPAPSPQPHRRWQYAIALAAGSIPAAWRYLTIMGNPSTFSLTYDSPFHLNSIRYIAESGSASPLEITHFKGYGGEVYPAAFHDICALIMQVNGGFPTAAIHAVVLVSLTASWTLALIGCVNILAPSSPYRVVTAGVMSGACALFPLFLTEWGVLQPNLVGLTFLPLIVGLVAQYMGWTPAPRGQLSALALASMIAVGAGLCHPNVVVTAVAFFLPGFILTLASRVSRLFMTRATARRDYLIAVEPGFFALLAVGILWKVHPGTRTNLWPGNESLKQSIIDVFLTRVPERPYANLILAVLVLLGLAFTLSRRMAWLLTGWGFMVCIYILMAAGPSGFIRGRLTWPWYSDYWRFSAMLAVFTLLIAMLGVIYALELQWLKPRPIAALTLVAVFAATQFGGNLQDQAAVSASYYKPADNRVLDDSKMRVIAAIPDAVPAAAGIVNVPGNGSEFAYGLTGRTMLYPYLLYSPTTDQAYLRENLGNLHDPQVCSILNHGQWQYVLYFGASDGEDEPYYGHVRLPEQPGFTPVFVDGRNGLYRIDGCR